MSIIQDFKVNLYSRIAKWLSDTGIADEAWFRNSIESEITGLGDKICDNLLPMLKWQLPLDKAFKIKWSAEGAARWIERTPLPNGQWPTQTEYYKWIFLDNCHNRECVKRWIEVIEYLYPDCSEIRTDDQVYDDLCEIMWQFTNDLANKEFVRLTHYPQLKDF